jgi:hypothetical protein
VKGAGAGFQFQARLRGAEQGGWKDEEGARVIAPLPKINADSREVAQL